VLLVWCLLAVGSFAAHQFAHRHHCRLEKVGYLQVFTGLFPNFCWAGVTWFQEVHIDSCSCDNCLPKDKMGPWREQDG